jgi:hypothetical protein
MGFSLKHREQISNPSPFNREREIVLITTEREFKG